MTRIFISYRREEGGAWAGRLYDRLWLPTWEPWAGLLLQLEVLPGKGVA
jgi:hypothetical protein